MSSLSAYAPPLQALPLLNNPNEKLNRELFIGNTPPGTSELLLQHFVNAAMRRVGLCPPHETPVLNARVNNKFAFVELNSADSANQCLHLNGIPFLNGTFLKVSRPSKYVGPPTVTTVSWQQLTGQDASQVPDPEMEKLKRELFIGNTTPEMTPQFLQDFLGDAMEKVGLATGPGNPITACRVSGKFAFVELRSSQEAANALHLNNIPCQGTALRVGRPSKYNGPPDKHGNWEDMLTQVLLKGGAGSAGAFMTANNNNNNSTLQANSTLPVPSAAAAVAAPTSRVVELQHMLTTDDLNNPDEYQEVMDDTREQCSEFGTLKSVIIPRLGEPGATKIFLEYESLTDAAAAVQELQGRTFDGRLVEATYFDEQKFANQQYE